MGGPLEGLRVLTGSLGQRGPDFEDDPRAFRIAALGGSFTFGLGLDQGEDWPTALQHAEELNDWVVNGGFSPDGLTTPEALTGVALTARLMLQHRYEPTGPI